ncbi:hypothetical protein BST33_12870 [Mycolicibacter minnesotensis]|uniref:DUF732 domain-containing protein n=2 Tax=Mycolicibacter minnesotensis TaxID=1118379 RepID=A0AA91M4D4_9MYCO|nr:DUF732 domain-containing protein [Mycolicibacter minnesotensis]ORA99965.1 hypothetical protein BST33_12870 [Mycolicibacter minnesotensis]
MRGVFLALGVAVTIVGAAPAGADPDGGGDGGAGDAAFLAALRAAGLTFSSDQQAIVAGHAVCSMANNGEPGLSVVKQLTTDNPGLSMDAASQFAAAAAKAYCPQHLRK